MKGLIYGGTRSVTIGEVPEPTLRPGTLLLRPRTVGLCFTDKLAYESSAFSAYPKGVVIGHEFCASVVDAADDVEGFAVGDLVAPDPRIYCGGCLQCRAGFETMCSNVGGWIGVAVWNGAMADLTLAPAMNAFKLEPGMTVLDGAAVEPMAYSLRAVRHSGIVAGDNVVVLGLEDYGQGVAQISKSIARTVVAADPYEVRRRAVERAGVSHVLDTSEGLAQEIRGLMPFGADVVFLQAEEYTPRSQRYLEEAYEIARVGGLIKVVRLSGPEILARADAQLASVKELMLSYNGGAFCMEPWRGGRDRGDWKTTMEAMGAGLLAPEMLDGLTVPFDDLRSQADVDAVFAALPAETAKVFIQVSE
jgi:(R,R)-butanediol dehydrogenase/meso-butanediol dehydrogenase/diacetyl reductase